MAPPPDAPGAERRRHRRVSPGIELTFSGSSGGPTCRLGDISWGGCFIQTLAEPALGERIIVTLVIADRPVAIDATVVCLERPLGFSVQFDPLNEAQVGALKAILGEPPAKL